MNQCKCGQTARPGQRNCRDCHKAAQRKYRAGKALQREKLVALLQKGLADVQAVALA